MSKDTTRDAAAFAGFIAEDIKNVLSINSFEIIPLKGDASTRRYYRVCGEGKSAVVMRLPADPLKSEEICSEAKFNFVELPFLNIGRFLAKKGLRTPETLLDKTSEGFLVLEDLGDITLGDFLKSKSDDDILRYYKAALNIAAKVQEFTKDLKKEGCYAAERRFDRALLYGELMHFVEYGLGTKLGKPLPIPALREIEAWFDRLAKELDEKPKVLCLRDFQSRNIMMKKGDMVLIDYQDALLGTTVYDFVSLTRDSYTDITHLLPELMPYAFETLGRPEVRFFEFERLYDLQTLQRKLKDAGRFVYIDALKKNPSFLQFIPQSLKYVKRAFGRLPEYAPLWNLLSEFEPELK